VNPLGAAILFLKLDAAVALVMNIIEHSANIENASSIMTVSGVILFSFIYIYPVLGNGGDRD
jgi:formate-dependent nitrite reductase membrane component NrfD